jgi:hypothetical protein
VVDHRADSLMPQNTGIPSQTDLTTSGVAAK